MGRCDVVIVGGGITGLAAAYRLRRLAPEVGVRLLETAPRLGGKIATEMRDGYVLEAGPDCFLSRKPRGIALCRELGLEAELVGRDPDYERTYIRRHGRLHPLPAGLSGIVPTDVEALERSALLSDEGRSRLSLDLTIPPSPDTGDESVAAFVTRRLGRQAFENLVEPLMGGIYAGQADQLSLMATFPHLRRLEQEHGSLLVGLREVPPAPNGLPSFVSLRGGMRRLVDALSTAIGGSVVTTGARVVSVVAEDGGFHIAWERADAGDRVRTESVHARVLVLTTPTFASANILRELDRPLSAVLDAIPYASTALVTLAYQEVAVAHRLDGYGYVIPQVEGDDVLACTWTSRKWPARAPEGVHLVRVYMGRFEQRDVTELDDDELVAMARRELRDTLDIEAAPMMQVIHRWPRGIPQYTMGHLERVAAIRKYAAARPGLLFAGAAFGGVGIPDCIRDGETAAEQAVAYLARSPSPSGG